jgi:acetyltransferase-like isoleucine patch superfamily enzyme
MFYGPIKFTDISGNIIIKERQIRTGMIGFGQRFEFMKKHKGYAELSLKGTLVFKSYAHIGKDCFIHISKNAYCEFGFMGCLGSSVKLICTEKIILGIWVGLGYESQISDTNYHPMMNLETRSHYAMQAPIIIQDYNSFANRVSVQPGTKTPKHCVIASNSLCNRDYTEFGERILLGGIPAKLLKSNFVRDWEFEAQDLLKSKILWQDYKTLLS